MLIKVLRARTYKVLLSTAIGVGALCMMPSCSDDYEWAQEKPSWGKAFMTSCHVEVISVFT